MITVYFHGAPGGPGELDWAGPAGGHAIAIDRFGLPAGTSAELVDALVERIGSVAAHGPLRFIGFSAGCRWALAVAARLGARVECIDLIAPLGPFRLGHYGPRLKGYPLFELARKRPGALRWVLACQALLARRAPGLLLRLLLQGSRGADGTLAQDPAFRALLLALLRHALEAKGCYARELVFASKDWSPVLAEVAAPVRIWHGAQDDWAAPGMGEALARRLPNGSATILGGLSHYSALQRTLPTLLS